MKKYSKAKIVVASNQSEGFLSSLSDPLIDNLSRHGVDFEAFKNKLVDPTFYRMFYKDLERLTDESLCSHWSGLGVKEGRIPNLSAYITSQLGDEKLAADFLSSIWFYRECYPDLQNDEQCDYRLVFHYFATGKKEGRFFTPYDWFVGAGISDQALLERLQSALREYRANTLAHEQLNVSQVLHGLIGLNSVPVDICHNRRLSSRLYTDLAIEILKEEVRRPQGINLLQSSIYLGGARAYELLGNIALDSNDIELAISLFKESICSGSASEWVYKNLSDIYVKKGLITDAIEVLLTGLKSKPESHLVVDSYKANLSLFWEESSHLLDGLKVLPKARLRMVSLANRRSLKLYEYWSALHSIEGICTSVRNNVDRVLIIGDFHLSQCVRYRIDQKIEQLELLGHQVDTISWTELGESSTYIPFYDVVIFYRVPAVGSIIEQISAARALGKIVIYEIDDQIFLPDYPTDLESYGGSIGMDTYHGLTMGMALNNSAVKLCDYSLASTEPINRALKSLTIKGDGYIHRNGLDQLNWFENGQRNNDRFVTLFYGSGTLAHNSDFIDLALPAIEKLLTEFSNVRLVIMGHLTLPAYFQKKYKKQFKKIPKLNDVKAYSALLSKADISLAVLQADGINDGKSELKWFEAACFQIPSVLSATENYRDIIRHGEDAFLAETVGQWYEYLRLLIVDKRLRERIGAQAQKRVRLDYSLRTLGGGLSAYIKQLASFEVINKKPKICIVNVFFPPQSLGGATRVVADNFDVLVEQYSSDFELCIFTSDVTDQEPYKVSAYSYKGVRVYKASVLFRENMDWHHKDEKMYDIFKEFLSSEKPDKVHFHCVQRLTASIVEATRDMEVPYLITAHDAWWISDYQFLVDPAGKVYPEGHPEPLEPDPFDYDMRVLPSNVSLDDSAARNKYLKQLLNDAERVLTVSESFAEIYRINGVASIETTKNGISSSKAWSPKDTSYTGRVVCAHIGGMSNHKGYDIFQSAVTELQPQNIELLVVDHSKPQDFSSVEYWGEVKVTYIGRQSQDDVVNLYSRIDVLFTPSIWPESFGLVTREAAACGCWIVASDLGGIGEDVSTGSGFVITPTVKAIKKTIREINNNINRYKGQSNAIISRLVSAQVDELIDYYKR